MSSSSSSISEGEQTRAAAYALGPMTPGGVGRLVEGLAIFYGIIAVIVLSIRIWIRSGFSSASPTGLWGIDDYLVVLGTVSRLSRDRNFPKLCNVKGMVAISAKKCVQHRHLRNCKLIPSRISQLIFMVAVVFAVCAAQFGIGSHDSDLPSELYAIRAGEYEVYWELSYFISSTIIKCAVGCTCIRLDPRRQITIPILINISLMSAPPFLRPSYSTTFLRTFPIKSSSVELLL